MKNRRTFVFVATLAALLTPFFSASAHQPRLVGNASTAVPEPEISKAYYGELSGAAHAFTINSESPFSLYVGLLVPDVPGIKTDISATIIKKGPESAPFKVLDGAQSPWQKYYEPFGADHYLKGPDFKENAPAGMYEIRVENPAMKGKYVLAIGEKEAFTAAQTWNVLKVIPGLKKNFFHTSPATFLLSPIGGVYALAAVLAGMLLGLLYRSMLKWFAHGPSRRVVNNIGKWDRVARAAIALFLFVWAVATSWSPILLLAAGFTLFEAIFSWCAFYSAIGKNTCPL